MNTAGSHRNTLTTIRSNADGGMAPLLILLFCVVIVLAGPLFRGSSNAWAQLNASQAQSSFRLVGTIEGGPITGAVIDDTKNPQAFYRLNEKLPDESQIVKVRSDYIVLKWPDGTRTELYATPGGVGNARMATTAAAPSVPARRVDQPAPINQDAAGRRPPRMDRQIPNQQGAKVQDPNARTAGGGGNRNKPRPNSRN